jgi:hypothetical protein
VYCGQLDALEGFAWIEWWVLSPIHTITLIMRHYQGPSDVRIRVCFGHRCTSCSTRGWIRRSGGVLVGTISRDVFLFHRQFECLLLFLSPPPHKPLPLSISQVHSLSLIRVNCFTVLESDLNVPRARGTWGHARLMMFVSLTS